MAISSAPSIQPATGWDALIVRIQSDEAGIRCELRNGRTILVPAEWKLQLSIADRLWVPEKVEALDRSTLFYLERREGLDICQLSVTAAWKPRVSQEGVSIIALDAASVRPEISRVLLTSAQIRDYFFAPDRRCPWHQQRTWYEILGVSEASVPAMLRLSYRVRQLEANTGRTDSNPSLAQLARGFQLLMDPDLHEGYSSLLRDPTYPVPFPPYTVGYLLVSGARRENAFVVDRILRYVPATEQQSVRVPLRKLRFDGLFAEYRNCRRKVMVRLDSGVLPITWTNDWNDWCHLTRGSIEVSADFWQQTRFRRRGDTFHPVVWRMPAIATLTVALQKDLAAQFERARSFWKRFYPHADTIALLRALIERQPIEVKEARRWCQEHGVPPVADVHLVNAMPDFDHRYYNELASRAQQTYLFRNEYLFLFGGMIVSEIPQAGHASYLFRPSGSLDGWLRSYAQTTRRKIRQDKVKSRQTLGYCGFVPHVHEFEAWAQKIRLRLETPSGT